LPVLQGEAHELALRRMIQHVAATAMPASQQQQQQLVAPRVPVSLYPLPTFGNPVAPSATAAAASHSTQAIAASAAAAAAAAAAAPSPSQPASGLSTHHAALLCNTCGRPPSGKSSHHSNHHNSQAVSLARCSGCRAVYCQCFACMLVSPDDFICPCLALILFFLCICSCA
jgi:hypothetical protein